jgi:PAS domain S-box-containing protein
LLTDLNVLQAPRLFSLAIIGLGLCAGALLIADFVKLSYVNQELSAHLRRTNSELGVALARAEETARLKNELLAMDLLQRFERNFRTLIERSPEAVVIRQQGRVVYVNPAGLRLLGYTEPSGVLGTEWSAVLHPEDRAAAEAAAPLVEKEGLSSLREQQLLRADGVAVVVELTELALEFNGLPSTVVLARDISERKQMQARLLLTDRLASVGTLATGIAHEINNPMSYVTVNLVQLSSELAELARWSGDPKTAGCDLGELSQIATEALEGARRVNKIVKELKIFARGDDERLVPVDMRAVVKDSLNIALHELKHRARLVLELEDVPPVLANESKLGQVCLNLLINAGQAIPRGEADRHQIVIRTRGREDGWALLEISDTGCGISPENQRRLFDPFFTTKPVGEGTGLGLSICHGIIQQLGGAIEVESAVGQGSLFRVVLPPHRAAFPDEQGALSTQGQRPL